MYRAWREISDSYPGERIFVGEVWLHTPERVARYVRPGELHTAFNFHFLWRPGMRPPCAIIDRSMGALVEVGAPADMGALQPRRDSPRDRYGGGEQRAPATASGSPADARAARRRLRVPGRGAGPGGGRGSARRGRQDPTFYRTAGTRKGRDGCRVPIPWGGAEPPFDFGPGPTAWLPQPDEWATRTVAAEDGDPESMLELYRRTLALRRRLPALGDGTMAWINVAPRVLAFRREPGFVCLVNFADEPAELPQDLADAEVLAVQRAARPARCPAARHRRSGSDCDASECLTPSEC